MIELSDIKDRRLSEETTLRKTQMVMLRMLKVVDYICEKHQLKYWLCSGTLLGAIRHKGFIPWDDDLDISMEREDYEKFLKIASSELDEANLFLQTRETDPYYTYLPVCCKIRDNNSLLITVFDVGKKYHRGIFIDVFAVDKFHENGLSFVLEYLVKKYFYALMSASDAPVYKNRSALKYVLSYFHPVFDFLLKKYVGWIPSKIEKSKSLTENYKMGFGYDVPWGRYWNQSVIYPLKKIPFEDGMFWAPNDIHRYLVESYGDTYMQCPPENKRPVHAGFDVQVCLKEEIVNNNNVNNSAEI